MSDVVAFNGTAQVPAPVVSPVESKGTLLWSGNGGKKLITLLTLERELGLTFEALGVAS